MGECVVVTGATGFIGLHLVEALRAKGAEVRALVRPRRHADPQIAQLRAAGAELVEADLTEGAPHNAFAGATFVYHAAGQLLRHGVPPEFYRQLHVEGTRAVLAACAAQANPPRIVHVSTTGVLGITGNARPDEEAALRPETLYERTKAEGEQLALQFAAERGLHLTVARPGLVYGPGDLHLLGWFRSIDKGMYRVVGNGRNVLHPIYISDLVNGLLACGNAMRSGRVYHLVGSEIVTMRALAAGIAAALGRRMPKITLPALLAYTIGALLETLPALPPDKLPLTRSRVEFMTASRAYTGERARYELGFHPHTDLASGLAATVTWYRNEGLL